MQEDDNEILRAEIDSQQRVNQPEEPRHHRHHHGARRESTVPYEEEVEEVHSRRGSMSSSCSSASTDSVSTGVTRLEQIRTRAQSQASTTRSRGTTMNSIYRHPTETDPEALRRIETIRSQHLATVGSTVTRRSTRKEKPLPPMGADKPHPPPLPEREEYVVEYDGANDPLHAQNWPVKKK